MSGIIFEANGSHRVDFEGIFGAGIGDDAIFCGAIVERDSVGGAGEEVDGG